LPKVAILFEKKTAPKFLPFLQQIVSNQKEEKSKRAHRVVYFLEFAINATFPQAMIAPTSQQVLQMQVRSQMFEVLTATDINELHKCQLFVRRFFEKVKCSKNFRNV
jgi:hypothetical protein